MSEEPEQPQGQQLQVSITDDSKHGTYANFLIVSHSAHEFTLDFCQIQPGGSASERRADVVSRVRIAPTLVGKVLRALNTNLANYEERFGPVPVVDE